MLAPRKTRSMSRRPRQIALVLLVLAFWVAHIGPASDTVDLTLHQR